LIIELSPTVGEIAKMGVCHQEEVSATQMHEAILTMQLTKSFRAKNVQELDQSIT
jgi:hypothetical protein